MATKHKWRQVTVVGCGLIGGSFALALKRMNGSTRVLGWDTSISALDEAIALGVVDEVDPALAAGDVSASDLLYLAMPVLQIAEFLRQPASHSKPGAIITDAGSTKRIICEAAQRNLTESHNFVGGHPIAGSHCSGVAHARADLFAGAPYVLTTDNSAANSEAFAAIRKTMQGLGARVHVMTAARHDRALALVSHLPQLLSSALAASVGDQNDAREILPLAGPAYKDMSRLASSSWTMWHDVLVTNRGDIAGALHGVIEKLTSLRDELVRGCCDNDSGSPVARKLFKEN